MKPSIKKIFKNLNFFILLSLTLSFISLLFIVEQLYSYQKVETLQKQKVTLLKIANEKKASSSINLIQLNGNISTLKQQTQSLIKQNEYNYISKSILDDFDKYSTQLVTLNSLINTYNSNLRAYFKFDKNDLQKITKSLELDNLNNTIIKHIDTIIVKGISYDNHRFNIFLQFFILLLITLFFTGIWYKRRLANIYKDLVLLDAIDFNKNNKKFFSREAESINLKMKRKALLSDNPNMIDPVTEIYNNKGMIQAYSEKRNTNNQNFTCVSVLEIDNFSKSKRAFSQEFTQNILKKIAYTISLYEQSTDIVSRTDYNQFTLILSRVAQDQLFKDIDIIRQSISEVKFTSPEKKPVNITVTGSFIVKSKNSALEESIRKAKKLLENAKLIGTNRIIQTKDIPK